MAQYLSTEDLDEVADAVENTLGYDSGIRKVLQTGLPTRFAAMMPGGAGGLLPTVSLKLDLGHLNKAGRLLDGRIPFKVWLQNVLREAPDTEDVNPVRKALAEVEGGATGAPRIVAAIDTTVSKEKLVHRDDMVPYRFMEAGVEAAHAVAKLTVPRFEGGVPKKNGANVVTYLGTGWLIADGLLMTNHHVINARDRGQAPAGEVDLRAQAAGAEIIFDLDAEGRAGTTTTSSELVAWEPDLDYALLRVPVSGRKPLTLAPASIEKIEDDTALAVNIIQHPDGRPKRFGIRNNLVTEATAIELRYFTDTLEGSSGSPVLNDSWEVVALHVGAAFVKGVKFQGREAHYVNVGTQLHAILSDLKKRYIGKLPELGI